ncbi:MAG: type II toxin-antitoxin system death-on-curing family toxin [Gemmataceae bacterium]
MIYLTADEVIRLQADVIAQSGGLPGVKNRGLVESAVALPRQTFGGQELYPTLADKAAALGYSLARNHAFEDGNKRIAHAALETFLVWNGHELDAAVDEQEDVFLRLAAGAISRDEFTDWVRRSMKPLG